MTEIRGPYWVIYTQYRGHLVRRYYWDEKCTRPRFLFAAFVGSELVSGCCLADVKKQIDKIYEVA